MAEKRTYLKILLLILFVFLLILIVFAVKSANSSAITGNAISFSFGSSCTDKDGWNFYSAGRCVSGKSVYNDYCVSNAVVEYNCVKRKCSFKLIDCPAGSNCHNGACITADNYTS